MSTPTDTPADLSGPLVTRICLVLAIDKSTGDERPEIGCDLFYNREDADRAAHSANLVARAGLYYRVADFDRALGACTCPRNPRTPEEYAAIRANPVHLPGCPRRTP